MADLRAARAKRAGSGGALGKLKARQNGAAKPPEAKGALAKLRGQTPKKPALAGLKDRKKGNSASDDFEDGLGRLFTNPVVMGETKQGRPYGSVDIKVGKKVLSRTYTFHNRFSCWYYDVPGGGGAMKEPNPQTETNRDLTRRFDRELKRLGIMTVAEKRAKMAEEEGKKRKRLAELEARREAKKQAKAESS